MAGFRDMVVYQKVFEMSKMVFRLSKRFPKEEIYSLTDQIRRSSRSVSVNFGEGYRKRRYPKHFIAKVSDSDAENTETQIWHDHAVACEYVTVTDIQPILDISEEVGKMLSHCMDFPEKYCIKPKL